LLLPALPRITKTRVVTVASSGSKLGNIDFGNLQSERNYRPMWGTYSQAKLADLIFALEFQGRIGATGTPLMSKDYPVATPIAKQAIDTAVAKHLWSISEELTGVSYGQLSNVS
jgi:hypothetical protein